MALVILGVAVFLYLCRCCHKAPISPSLNPHQTQPSPKGSTGSLFEKRVSKTTKDESRDKQSDILSQVEEGQMNFELQDYVEEPLTINDSHSSPQPPAETVSLEEPKELSQFPTQLHAFINLRVIPGFEGQRKAGHFQFAVLLLVGESSLDNICNYFVFEPHDGNRQPLVNNTQPYWPNHRCLGNYMVARPRNPNRRDIKQGKRTTHSERILLQELPNLLRSSKVQQPANIILYSWLMPCPDCTAAIIRELHFGSLKNVSASVVVVYTIDWLKTSLTENEASRAQLTEAGITVEQIKYYKTLPHTGNADDDDDDYYDIYNEDNNGDYNDYDNYNAYNYGYNDYSYDYDTLYI